MHFEIHASPSSEPNVTLYHFEDEQFRSVVDLIEFYHSHRRKVTASSGFLLGRPVICSQRAYTLSQSDLLYACSTENFQIEIEAAYAPFLGKPSEKSVPLRNDRTLTQHAILNQAKKRLTGGEYKSEHDLAHLTSTSTPSSPANNPLGTGPLAASRSVFYVNHLDYGPPENHEIPKLNGKTSPPRIPLPISPIVMPEDVDDYCEMDYSAMDELRVETPSPTSLSSAVLSSPSSGSRKRYSEILDASMTDLQSTFDTPINLNNPFRRSAHSLNHNLITPTSAEPYDEQNVPAKLSSYWDRTQSCQNLYGVRMKLNRSTSGTSYGQAMESPIEKETEFKRFPSIRIEPAPILPARSTDNLNSTASPIKETSVDPDYDRIVRNLGNNSTRESDYDRLKFDQESDYGRLKLNQESDYDHPPKNGQKIEKYSRNGVRMEENSQNGGTFSKPTSSNQKSYTNGLSIRPPTAPKPTLAKLKAQSQVGPPLIRSDGSRTDFSSLITSLLRSDAFGNITSRRSDAFRNVLTRSETFRRVQKRSGARPNASERF
uniref:SH2 domain-containing protein n=1 Tax=Acrobeloides nanus TaxID=290746 RepID=A0A914CV42_9BILA